MKKFFYTLIFILFTQTAFSQAYTYYPFNSVFSISSNPTRFFWVDCRFQTNSFFSSLTTEVAPMFNISTIGKAKIYVGAGGRFNFLNYLNSDPANRNPFEAYFMSVGTRISPFKTAPGVQVVFELTPDISKSIDLGQFRSRMGIAYVFRAK